MMKFSLVASILPSALAFVAPSNKSVKPTTSLNEKLNGWVPDESKFAFGLPGSLDPAEDFDPLGFAANADLTQMKGYREAATTHGRVAMLAVIGFLVTEAPVGYQSCTDEAIPRSRDNARPCCHVS